MRRREFIGNILTIGLAIGCRRNELSIPFRHRKDTAPTYDNKLTFRTTFPNKFLPLGIEVTTFNNVPFSIKGNQGCVNTCGSIPKYALASLFNLYDKKRLRKPTINSRLVSCVESISYIFEKVQLARKQKRKILLVSNETNSPFQKQILDKITNTFPNIVFFELPSIDFYTNRQQANRLLFSESFYDLKNIKNSEIILNFGSDFLNNDFFAPYFQSQLNKQLTITFEDFFTTTGARSISHHLVDKQELLAYEFQILKEVERIKGTSFLPFELNLPIRLPESLANFLLMNQTKSLAVLVNNSLPPIFHIIGELIETFWNLENNLPNKCLLTNTNFYENYTNLLDSIAHDNCELIIFLDFNPFFGNYPELRNLLQLFPKNKIVSLSYYFDDIARLSSVNIPSKHFLECSLDHKNLDGSIASQQAVIQPLNKESISTIEFLYLLHQFLTYGNTDIEEIINFDFVLRNHYLPNFKNEIELRESIKNGYFVKKNTQTQKNMKLNKIDWNVIKDEIDYFYTQLNEKKQVITIQIINNINNYDSIYCNNPYLMQIPEPIYGTVYENPLIIPGTLAKNLQFTNNSIVNILSLNNNKSAESKVVISSRCKSPYAFFDLSKIIAFKNLPEINFPNFNELIDIAYKNTSHFIQTNNEFDAKLTVASTLTNQSKHFAIKTAEKISNRETINKIMSPFETETTKSFFYANSQVDGWYVIIDIDKCIGCNQCILACQLENNIPIVDPEYFESQKELFWIRVQKYELSHNHLIFLPIMCQHCDNAPCESVCPVNATNHSSDGVNEMTYSRCIGSRFCMANCPYKVRRFNFTSPEKYSFKLIPEMLNPFVSLRSRGVTEKCTLCIHRIREAKSISNSDSYTFTTACQDACTTKAITIIKKEELKTINNLFVMLSEFNTSPRVLYKSDLIKKLYESK